MNKIKNPWVIFGGIFTIFTIYFLIIILVDVDISKKGTFGDSFGVLTSLFSALAFGVLIITLWQQKEDLDLTREELKNSVDALQQQSRSLQQQNFENTFFKLVDLHNKIADYAYDIFEKNLFVLHDIVPEENNDPFDTYSNRLGGTKSYRTTKNYYSFFRSNIKIVDSYFRNVSQVLNFISSSKIEDKQQYANIFRTQFSTLELEFLFFHAITLFESIELKELLEKYAFFEPLILDEFYKEDDILRYDFSVFGNYAKNNTLNTLKLINLKEKQNNTKKA